MADWILQNSLMAAVLASVVALVCRVKSGHGTTHGVPQAEQRAMLSAPPVSV
jgi:hypothetical protein